LIADHADFPDETYMLIQVRASHLAIACHKFFGEQELAVYGRVPQEPKNSRVYGFVLTITLFRGMWGHDFTG
jgi:hypothetical protein